MTKPKKPSHTQTFLYVWLILLPLLFLVQAFISSLPATAPGYGLLLPMTLIIQFTGMGSFAYLGLEYAHQALANSQLPRGEGSVKNLRRYKLLAFVWLGYLLLAILISLLVRVTPPLPLSDLATYAGIIMVTFVGGQKTSKISARVGPPPDPTAPTAPDPITPEAATPRDN